MRLYIQALIWFFAAYLLVSPAHAHFLVPIIASLASTALGKVILNAAIGIALSIGSSLLQAMIAKKSRSRDPGTTVQLRIGGANPLMFPLGRCATAGVRVYHGLWTETDKTPNEYIVDVIAYSVIPLPGATPVLWLNDKKANVRFDLPKTQMGWPIEDYYKKGNYYAWVDFHDGTQTTSNIYLRNKFGNHSDYPWTNNMVGRGVAYATITCRYERDGLWQSGYPSALFEIPSIPLYDIRKDSTRGGVGSHRIGQFDTYEPSDNAMVRAFNVILGIYYENEWVYGGQNLPIHRLHASSWMSAMNACDIMVDGEPQFHGGGIVECDLEIVTVLEELLRSSSALIAETGGQYKVRVGAPGAPVMSFTDANIVVTREQGYEPFPGLESTYNIARITYTEPGEKWAVKESPERRDELAIASDDGRELPFSVDLPWVTSNLTAQRIGKTALENGRRFRRHSMYHTPLFWLIEPLDVVAWTSEHQSYIDKKFDVEKKVGNSSLIQQLVIRENEPSDYVWDPVNDALPYQVVPIIPQITPPQVMSGWQVFPAVIKDELGRNRRPSIEVNFDGSLSDIDRVRVWVRVEGETDPFWTGDVPYPDDPVSTARVILNGDFAPNVAMQVQGQFIPFTDRDTLVSGWLNVTTPNIKLIPGLDFDPYEDIDLDSLADDFAGYLNWTGSGLREIERRLEELDTLIADQDLGNETDRQSIRQQITATYEYSKAEWSYAVDLVVTANEALAQRVEQLDAEVFDPDTGLPSVASAVDILSAYAGPDGTLAEAITSLSASTNPADVSEANFRMQTVTGPTGYSRIGAQTRQGGVGEWRGAAWYLDTPNDTNLPTRFVVDAEQIVFGDSSGLFAPFILEGGVARFNETKVRNLTGDNIIANSVHGDRVMAGTLEAAAWAPPTAGDNVIFDFLGGFSAPGIGNSFMPSPKFPSFLGLRVPSGGGGTSISATYFGCTVRHGGVIRLKLQHYRDNGDNPVTMTNTIVRVYRNGTQIQQWTTTALAASPAQESMDIAVDSGDNITIGAGVPGTGGGFTVVENAVICSDNITPAVY